MEGVEWGGTGQLQRWSDWDQNRTGSAVLECALFSLLVGPDQLARTNVDWSQ